jgi:hypothetical protein
MESKAPVKRVDTRIAIAWLAVVSLAVAVSGLAVYRAWPVLFPAVAERAPLNDACDLERTGCRVSFSEGGAVRLDVMPRGIPVVQPLQIEVELSDLPSPLRVELDFAGVDMDMGYNRVSLTPVDEQPGLYRGAGMLPVCVRDRMTWEARVLIFLEDGTLSAPFRFETTRRG